MNLTLSIEENALRHAREYAEKHHTSVNQLIRDHLNRLTKATQKQQRAEEAQAFFEGITPTVLGNVKISRDEMEER